MNEGHTRAEVGLDQKRTKLPHKRFICCFHNGPGRKCAGTDETISEVIKKLSEQHDIHVCDRCWSLKETPGENDLVHGVTCRDYCLSPQCHGASPMAGHGHRHEFDQKTCGRKTSRVRPGDGEAVYRFIYLLVHPTLKVPGEILTARRSGHLDSVSRQGRRKPNRDELSVRVDDLEKKLDEGEKRNAANTARIEQLDRDLTAEVARNKELEKQKRRIVGMLSDALRTGTFRDRGGHLSLRERVREDAPEALGYELHSIPTPSTPSGSQRSGSTPSQDDGPMLVRGNGALDARIKTPEHGRSVHPSYGDDLEQLAVQDFAMDACFDNYDMDYGWLALAGGSGGDGNSSSIALND
jgi:hypothetical protein